jgi:glycosyltransferase involved in cell wall biosynthesis
MSPEGATVVYRGPLESSRLRFVLEAVAQSYGDPALVCLAPAGHRGPLEGALEDFVPTAPIIGCRVLDGRAAAIPSTVLALRRLLPRRPGPVVAVGFSAMVYAAAVAKGPLVWCITGIPEEWLMHDDSRRRRLYVEVSWRSARLGRRPDLVVTVSRPMSRLVERRFGPVPTFAAPTCVDHVTFGARQPGRRTHLTYLGSGAPWQCLDLLAEVWRALHRQSPELRFRVISRDHRAGLLGRGLPPESVEFVAAANGDAAARLLWEAEGGFMIRRPHLVNEVSYPTKFGEYVAAGVPVIASDVGWDPAELIRRTGCGLVIDWDSRPEAVAESVLVFRERAATGADLDAACRAAASSLDRSCWVRRLAAELPA